jgi:hypothetical protein
MPQVKTRPLERRYLRSNNTKKTKEDEKGFEKNPALKKFSFQGHIPQKYGSPKSRLSLESKGNYSAGYDVSDDAQLLRAVTPSSARIA